MRKSNDNSMGPGVESDAPPASARLPRAAPSSGWSTPAPATAWQEAASASERWTFRVGAGFGILGCLALAGVLWRSLAEPPERIDCNGGESCNAAAIGFAQAPDATQDELATAARLFRRACDMGHAPACNNLGLAYQGGTGVPQDYARAMSAFERACSEGLAEGCSNQGTLFENGSGVAANAGDALRAYDRACRRGSALGCSNLGVLYAEGRGVAPDDEMASRLFAQACSEGVQVGCHNLFELEHQSSERQFR